MTIQTTEPIMQFTVPSPGRVDEQAPVFEALGALVQIFPTLPRPYVVVYSSGQNGFLLQLSDPSHFEVWRTALQLPTEPVELKASGESVWLAADTAFRGVPVHLTGHGVPLTAEQAEASQAVSA